MWETAPFVQKGVKMDAFLHPAMRQALGVIVPFDMELDAELWRWVPADIDLLITRTPFVDDNVNVEFIREISTTQPLAVAARSLTAGRARTVAYACASGSFIGGASAEQGIRETILASGADNAVTASGALVEALAHLGCSRVSVATPYMAELSGYLDAFLIEFGMEVVHHGALGLDHEIWAVPEATTADLIRRVDLPEAEAIVVSCTNLPTFDLIAPLEQELGKPVITANQATVWASLRRLGREAVGPEQALIREAEAITIVPSAQEVFRDEAEIIA